MSRVAEPRGPMSPNTGPLSASVATRSSSSIVHAWSCARCSESREKEGSREQQGSPGTISRAPFSSPRLRYRLRKGRTPRHPCGARGGRGRGRRRDGSARRRHRWIRRHRAERVRRGLRRTGSPDRDLRRERRQRPFRAGRECDGHRVGGSQPGPTTCPLSWTRPATARPRVQLLLHRTSTSFGSLDRPLGPTCPNPPDDGSAFPAVREDAAK